MSKATNETTLLLGGAVITVDEERRIIDPGAVAVEGDRIVAVDDRETIQGEYSGDEEVELENAVLLPGLVDSHGHAGHGFTKGLGGGPGSAWMSAVDEVYFHASTEEFWEAESYLSALEHVEMGVTTSLSYPGSYPRVDDPKYAEAAASGYADLGLRHVVNLGPPDPPYPKAYTDAATGATREADLDDAIETTAAVIDSLDGTEDGRISAFVGPSSLVPEVVSDGEVRQTGLIGGGAFEPAEGDASETSIEQLEKVLELAESKGVNVHTHAFGGQVRAAAEAVPEILGPDLSLAHCAGLTDRELEIMAEHDVSASHGPLTHAYALSRFPVVEAMEAGVNVAISTDGAAPDRSFDLLSQGRVGAQLQRVHFNDIEVMPSGTVLEMMTIDAAESLGMADEVGSLEPGKQADVVAVDLDAAGLRPRTSLLHRIVHYASGNDVEFVMVDGEVLLRDDEPVDVDTQEILDRADEVALETFERAGVLDGIGTHSNAWGAVRY
jgi:cytosine/adenosine deaminase-related metal-dependent hydrolase